MSIQSILENYKAMQAETLAVLQEVARVHNFWVNHVAKFAVASDASQLQEQLKAFDIIDTANDKLIEIQKKVGALLAMMANKLLLEGFKAVNVPSQWVEGKEFVRAQRITGSFKDKVAGYDWLREIGEEALITETVNAQTLSAFLKTYLGENAITPPEFVKINTMDYVKHGTVKRSSKKYDTGTLAEVA